MKSTTDRQLLSAWIDDALDDEQRVAAQALLEHNPDLRRELEWMRSLRAAVRAHARHYVAPSALRLALNKRLAEKPVDARTPRLLGLLRPSAWPGLFAWHPMAVALSFAVLMAGTAVLVHWNSTGNERMMQAAVASHLRATTGLRLVDLASADREAIQPWLAERLAISSPVVVPSSVPAELVGARLDNLNGRAVAAVVYRVGHHVVDAFIWPADDDAATISSASLDGFSVSHWSRGGLRFCVVSDLPPHQMLAFAEALTRDQEVR
jgi:anti-sigma factor RsiW